MGRISLLGPKRVGITLLTFWPYATNVTTPARHGAKKSVHRVTSFLSELIDLVDYPALSDSAKANRDQRLGEVRLVVVVYGVHGAEANDGCFVTLDFRLFLNAQPHLDRRGFFECSLDELERLSGNTRPDQLDVVSISGFIGLRVLAQSGSDRIIDSGFPLL